MELLPPQTDWTAYLERKQPLFLFDSFIHPYGSLLKEATGFEFAHQLHSFSKGLGTFYRSKKEMEDADAHFLELIENNDSKLEEWAKKGFQVNALADGLVEEYGAKTSLTETEVKKILNSWEEILLFSTVVPYRVLSAANSAIEKGKDASSFHAALDLYEPLRGTTKYPQLIEVVFPKVWKYLAEKSEIQNEELLTTLTLGEIQDFLDGTELPIESELLDRWNGSVFWLDTKTNKTVLSNDLSLLAKVGITSEQEVVSEIKGSVAQRGKARGTARIVNDAADMGGFNDGDIVVSINTSPSLMPVLIKAGAIVTDEGGIMCHAAIVSRELKKPCVIGTKIATKVIKNGDIVEVDADAGIVRIIS